MATSPPQRASAQRASAQRASAQKASDSARALFDQFLSAPGAGDELPGTLLLVEIERVAPRQIQPRTVFDESSLQELAADIAALRARGGGVGGSGILQPLTVTETPPGSAPDPDSAQFHIVAGERRFRAARLAGCPKIPVIVRQGAKREGAKREGAKREAESEVWESEVWEDALRENLQRENLSPLEEARAISALMQRGNHSVRAVASRLGKGKGYIETRLALGKAGADVQDLVSRRQDTLSIAREIDRVPASALRAALIEAALGGAPVSILRARIEAASRPAPATMPDPESPSPARQLRRAGAILREITPADLDALSQAERAQSLEAAREIERWLADFQTRLQL